MNRLNLLAQRLLFYLRYAARNLRRERSWAAFSMFAVAAGVSAIVALRALGLSIGDSLTENVRSSNHGDISISVSSDNPFAGLATSSRNQENLFDEETLASIDSWVAARDGEWLAYREASNVQLFTEGEGGIGRPQFIAMLLIEPRAYGEVSAIRMREPRGETLASLLAAPQSIVISHNLADQRDLQVGDAVFLSGSETPYTVRGIVPTESEASLLNIFASFFGFAYVSFTEAETLGIDEAPNRIGITLPPGSDISAEARALARQLGDDGFEFRTTVELLENYEEITPILSDFIALMGLGALLIGGVGIINTMLVRVRHRALEIAALKTFGLKGRQVAALFLAEAAWLGVLGSALGCLGGILLGRVVNSYGETFLAQPLTWRIYPEALAFGVILGLSTTLTFSLAPLLITLQVRPVSVLRPNELAVPRVGLLQSLLSVLVLVLVAGAIISRILNHSLTEISDGALGSWNALLISCLLVAAVLAFLALLVFLLNFAVRLLSRLPSFGRATLRLATRNLATQRIRTATTILALATGMFALSSIAFAGQTVSEVLRFTFSQALGGNILVFPLLPQALPDEVFANLPHLRHHTHFANHDVTLLPPDDSAATGSAGTNGSDDFPAQARMPASLTVLSTNHPDIGQPEMAAGRFLTAADQGQPVIVLRADSPYAQLGQTVRVDFGDEILDLTVIGTLAPQTEATNAFTLTGISDAYIPAGVVESQAGEAFHILDVPPEFLNETLRDLARNPLTFSFDITFIDGLLRRIIDQFAAIPTVVGLLSLMSAAVIMANGVALATLERRRQIGILKALGMKRRQVLSALLLENALVGASGGLLGVGLSALGLRVFLSLNSQNLLPFPRETSQTALLLLAAAVGIALLATFLSARSATQAPALQVLRYD